MTGAKSRGEFSQSLMGCPWIKSAVGSGEDKGIPARQFKQKSDRVNSTSVFWPSVLRGLIRQKVQFLMPGIFASWFPAKDFSAHAQPD